jgi:hypothetical protein
MKKLNKIRIVNLLICLLLIIGVSYSQEAEKPELILHVGYYNTNNTVQHLKVQTQLKADNKLQALKDVVVQLYLDSLTPENLISKVRTNEKGVAETNIPISLRKQWLNAPNHKFIAVAEATRKEDETVAELEIAKAKIEIDTLNEDGTKSVSAKVFAYNNGEWIPAKDVEVTIGVKRLGGILKIGKEETYTTDSLGQVTGEFKLDTLPADDIKANITLVATVEDNDQFGNLSVEKTVPWGKYYKAPSNFGERSLSAARFRAPIWLMLIAYSIIAAVWAVIIYLIYLLVKIKKIGNAQLRTDRKTMNGIISEEVNVATS